MYRDSHMAASVNSLLVYILEESHTVWVQHIVQHGFYEWMFLSEV